MISCDSKTGSSHHVNQINLDTNIVELPTKLLQDINRSQERWNRIKSQLEFEHFYTHAQSLVKELSLQVNTITYEENKFIKYQDQQFSAEEDLEELESSLKHKLPFLGMTWVAEGTEVLFFLDKSVLLDKVTQIDYQNAEDFFRLSIKIYGNDLTSKEGFPIWIKQETDIQGTSKLGEMIHYNTLIELNDQLSQNDLFSSELKLIRNDLIEDFESYYFLNSKHSVLNELEIIIKSDLLSNDEKNKVREQIILIESEIEPLIKFNSSFLNASNFQSEEHDNDSTHEVFFIYKGSASMHINDEEVDNHFKLAFRLLNDTVQEGGMLELSAGFPNQYYITTGTKRNDTLEIETIEVQDARMSTIENAVASGKRNKMAFQINNSGYVLKYINNNKYSCYPPELTLNKFIEERGYEKY